MSIDTTDIHNLPTPDSDEPISSYPGQLKTLADAIDTKIIAWSEGPLAALPPGQDGVNPVGPTNPGNGRRAFRDVATDVVYIDCVDHWAKLNGTHVFYEEKTWAIPGQLKANPAVTDNEYILGFRVPLLADKQTSRVVAAYGEILQGTSATLSLHRRPWSASESVPTGWSGLSATTTPNEWTPTAFNLTHRDRLRLAVTAVAGTPYGLSFTVVIEHTLTV